MTATSLTRQTLTRRALALVLSLALTLAGMPTPAFASSAEEIPPAEVEIAAAAAAAPQADPVPSPAVTTAVTSATAAPNVSEVAPATASPVTTAQPESPTASAPLSAPELSASPVVASPAPAVTPQDDPATTDAEITITVRVIGPDAAGADVRWITDAPVALPSGSNAWDASERAFDDARLAYTLAYGYLDTITSPFTGEALGYDAATGRYWQLFVGDAASDVGAADVRPTADATITWYYSAYGDTLVGEPGTDPVGTITLDPGAPRPSYVADWAAPQRGGTDGGAHLSADTPTTTATAAWMADQKDGRAYVNCSAPVIAAGHVYLAVGDELRMLAAGTGKVARTAALAHTVGYNANIAYADGLIIVPLLDGRVQALTADTLATVWLADPFAVAVVGPFDPAPAIAITGGCAYVTHFGSLTASYTAVGGRMACVALADGAVRWVRDNPAGGYYTDGITFAAGVGVATDDAGRVVTFSLDDGRELDSALAERDATIRSAPVADAAGNVYVSAYDGTLYKFGVAADGSLTRLAAARFADYSASSAPTIVDGRVYVGGGVGTSGLLAVLAATDLASIARITATTAGELPGAVQSSPLVVTTPTGTYAYVTANAQPGGVYAWRLGDATATTLFTPPSEYANWCMGSPVADATGALYYLNDADVLFKLVSAAGVGTGGTTPSTPGAPSTTGAGAGGTSAATSGAGRGATSGGRTAATRRSAATGGALGRGGAATRSGERATADQHVSSPSGRRARSTARRAHTDTDTNADAGMAADGSTERVARDLTASAPADAADATDAGSADVSPSVPAWAVVGVVCGVTAAVGLAWWLRRLLAGRGER